MNQKKCKKNRNKIEDDMLETNFSEGIKKTHKWTQIKGDQKNLGIYKNTRRHENMLENKPSKHHKDRTYLYIKRQG